jgi:hypothetical protein
MWQSKVYGGSVEVDGNHYSSPTQQSFLESLAIEPFTKDWPQWTLLKDSSLEAVVPLSNLECEYPPIPKYLGIQNDQTPAAL